MQIRRHREEGNGIPPVSKFLETVARKATAWNAQEQIITRVITATHGREIGQLPPEKQPDVARQVLEEKLSLSGLSGWLLKGPLS